LKKFPNSLAVILKAAAMETRSHMATGETNKSFTCLVVTDKSQQNTETNEELQLNPRIQKGNVTTHFSRQF
jgi:hypothetical protein